jgi:nucleoside-triphosphatase THEP1
MHRRILRGGGPFIESVRRRQNVETILVARENREVLPERLAAMLSYFQKG